MEHFQLMVLYSAYSNDAIIQCVYLFVMDTPSTGHKRTGDRIQFAHGGEKKARKGKRQAVYTQYRKSINHI